ncbi:MAG: endonuclease [Saprospiraceae bacterium]|jgi:endonuclease I|nr:endonuclease [Saprospiraceae bacterium]
MLKSAILGILFFWANITWAQELVINELDCDTPGIDDKEFVEIKSETPNFNLNGYVLVFFNGSASGANTSYLALDLDGYTTDINGLLLIASTTVVPSPQYIIEPNLIQNGADAVAIYQGDAEDFPEGTLAFVDATLVDVLIYGTNDADAVDMIAIFQAFNPAIAQINEGPSNNTNSIQRNNDGSYFTGVPTPRFLNDGSGVVLNGVSTALTQTKYDEGETFDIVFTTEQAVAADFAINFRLSSGTFNAADFTGDTTLTIPGGQNSVTTTITLIDDNLDEGDEVMVLRLPNLPPAFLVLNNNIPIRIVDNDFVVAPFGTPINPTYGIVSSTQPAGYYDSLDGLAGDDLRQALQNIIADQAVVRGQTYNDVIDIVKEADQNPENSNQVWLVYLEQGRPKLDFQTASNITGVWNREHTFPRSRGGFDSIDADTLADGKAIFWTTNADSLRHANSDAHAIRAVDALENINRGNQFYGEYNGPPGTLGGFKGDMARGIFYLVIRYNGLEVVNGFPDGLTGQFGDLATLLDWHRNDPPDDFEMNRNNVVYTWQFNRNPFIDMPDLVEYFWGDLAGQPWQQPVNTDIVNPLSVRIFPNPAKNNLQITGITEPVTIEILTLQGQLRSKHQASADIALDINLASGMYFIKISSPGKTIVKKIIVE